jgi:hypothetical protein
VEVVLLLVLSVVLREVMLVQIQFLVQSHLLVEEVEVLD